MMKKHLLLTLLCVGSVTLYTADYNPDVNTGSPSKRFQKDDEAIQQIAAQLRQEVEEDQAITSLAASLREECESDNSLDNTAASPAAQLPEATAVGKPRAYRPHPRHSLEHFIFHKAGEPYDPKTLATLRTDEFKKRMEDALNKDMQIGVDGSVSCKGTFNACSKVRYATDTRCVNKRNFNLHCVNTHLTHEDICLINSLVTLVEDQKNTRQMYQCAACPLSSPLHKAQVRLHIVAEHILDKPAVKKLPTV